MGALRYSSDAPKVIWTWFYCVCVYKWKRVYVQYVFCVIYDRVVIDVEPTESHLYGSIFWEIDLIPNPSWLCFWS